MTGIPAPARYMAPHSQPPRCGAATITPLPAARASWTWSNPTMAIPAATSEWDSVGSRKLSAQYRPKLANTSATIRRSSSLLNGRPSTRPMCEATTARRPS